MALMYYVRALNRVVTEDEWRGLGDVIASATKAVGIVPCGSCKDRQERLNRAVPFGQPEPPKPVDKSP